MEERYQIFTGLILNISRCIQKIKNIEVADLGLKGKQVQCLYFLRKAKDGISLTQLCQLCDEDKGAMSRTIKELMAQNLVYLAENSTQKYRNPFKLTDKGEKSADIVTEKIARIVDMGGTGLAESDRDIFYRALLQVSNNLTQICEKYGEKNDSNFN